MNYIILTLIVLLVWTLYRAYRHYDARSKAKSLIPVAFELLKLNNRRSNAFNAIRHYLRDHHGVEVNESYISTILIEYLNSEEFRTKRAEEENRPNQEVLELKLRAKETGAAMESLVRLRKEIELELQTHEAPTQILYLTWRAPRRISHAIAA